MVNQDCYWMEAFMELPNLVVCWQSWDLQELERYAHHQHDTLNTCVWIFLAFHVVKSMYGWFVINICGFFLPTHNNPILPCFNYHRQQ